MMDRRIALLPLLMLAGTSLSGCVAVAIPALAGSAMVGVRAVEGDDGATPAPSSPAPVAAATPTPVIRPVPVPAEAAVTADTVQPRSDPASSPGASAPAPAPLASVPAAVPPATAAALPPAPRPAPSPARQAPEPIPAAPPVRVPAIPAASAATAPIAYPDPDKPLTAEQLGFARFVRYGQASAVGAKGGADLLSAILSDPVALDGQRRRCTPGEQMVAVIDLDPAGGTFSPPATPARQPGLALGLAVLRDAGVEIAWMSDLSTTQSGVLRAALEQSGLDPRGQDIIALRRDEADTKQQRRTSLGGIACIIAIAGDERSDFDERYKYLRTPEAGAALEPTIGNGWFLIAPLLQN